MEGAFCEESLPAWIKEPANTWSNIGYLLVGAAVFYLAGKARRPHLRIIGVVSAVTGIGSAYYHAFGTYWGGVFDLSGMYFGTGALTGLNVRRWQGWGYPATYATIILVTASLVGAMLVFPGEERLLYVLSGPCCLIELLLFIKRRREINYTNYLWAWGIVGVGTLFWWLDVSRRLCDPQNHVFGGHAAWHLLTALGYYFIYRFYAQFEIFASSSAVQKR